MQGFIKGSSSNTEKIIPIKRKLQQTQLLKEIMSVLSSQVQHMHCCLLGWRALLQQNPKVLHIARHLLSFPKYSLMPLGTHVNLKVSIQQNIFLDILEAVKNQKHPTSWHDRVGGPRKGKYTTSVLITWLVIHWWPVRQHCSLHSHQQGCRVGLLSTQQLTSQLHLKKQLVIQQLFPRSWVKKRTVCHCCLLLFDKNTSWSLLRPVPAGSVM